MMKPIKTKYTNKIFKAPKRWNKEQGECLDLPVYSSPPYQISWWKPSLKERFKILFGRNIRLSIIGESHPPVNIEIDPDKAKETI